MKLKLKLFLAKERPEIVRGSFKFKMPLSGNFDFEFGDPNQLGFLKNYGDVRKLVESNSLDVSHLLMALERNSQVFFQILGSVGYNLTDMNGYDSVLIGAKTLEYLNSGPFGIKPEIVRVLYKLGALETTSETCNMVYRIGCFSVLLNMLVRDGVRISSLEHFIRDRDNILSPLTIDSYRFTKMVYDMQKNPFIKTVDKFESFKDNLRGTTFTLDKRCVLTLLTIGKRNIENIDELPCLPLELWRLVFDKISFFDLLIPIRF